MSGKGGAEIPAIPEEFKQASLEMVELGREQLGLSREQYEYVKNTITPKIMAWQERAANSQQDISDFALSQAKESWGRFKEGDQFRNILKADAFNFLDMSEEDAQAYVTKQHERARGDFKVSSDPEYQAAFGNLKEKKDTALENFEKKFAPSAEEVAGNKPLSYSEWSKARWQKARADGHTGYDYSTWQSEYSKEHGGTTVRDLYDAYSDKLETKSAAAADDYKDSEKYKTGLQAINEKYAGKFAGLKEKYSTKGITGLEEEAQDLIDWREGQLAAEDRASRRAANDTAAAIAGMTEAQRMDAQALGIRPGTTRYAQAFGPSRLQAAGLSSATANAARGTAREGKIQKIQNMANISAGYPALSLSAGGQALQGYGAAGDRIGQGFGQVVNAYGLPQRTAALGLQAMQSGIYGLNSMYGNQLQAAGMAGGGSWTDSALGAVIGGIGAAAGTVMTGGAAAPALIAAGAGAAASANSSKDFKKNKKPIDAVKVSKDSEEDELYEYEYNERAPSGSPPGRHIGPIAEDVEKKYAIGDGKTIPMQDLIGLALVQTKGNAKRLARIERTLGLQKA